MPKEEEFQNQYRIDSTRLKDWDYSGPGYYFVTICTKDRRCYFGKIVNQKMQLSEIGRIVIEEWEKTPIIRQNVKLDFWVSMPNHLHGILIIMGLPQSNVETPRRGVSTTVGNQFLQPNSLGSIVGQFKSVATKKIREMGYNDFAWQPRFYDHIVRNEKSYWKICRYIYENPQHWEEDRNNPENLWM